MKVLLALAFVLLPPSLPAHAQWPGKADDAANQIRLDRPAGGGGGAAPAPAQPAGIVETVTVQDVLRIMRSAKFTSVTIEKNKDVEYVRAMIGDSRTVILPTNCDAGRCSALLFVAYLGKQDSVDAAFMNSYNRAMLFTKMSKDSDDDLVIEMGIPLFDGVTEAHIRAVGNGWIRYFSDALNYKP